MSRLKKPNDPYRAKSFNKSWIDLHRSRGIETYEHKLFMRSTVLLADIMTYIPAVIFFWITTSNAYKWPSISKDSERLVSISITSMLLYPGLILIDHGHFQYNCISLGFTLLAVTLILRQNLVLASVFFVLSLNYKQMSLYYSLSFFFYILAYAWNQSNLFQCSKKILIVGLTVVGTFAICWMPFLTSIENINHVIRRLFPVDRGLYEDKVANFWCVVEIVLKLRRFLNMSQLVKLSAITTLSSILPSSLAMMVSPSFMNFKYNLVISSLGFFLFSYQVHEKSILLASLPVMLLSDRHPLPTFWFCVISTFR